MPLKGPADLTSLVAGNQLAAGAFFAKMTVCGFATVASLQPFAIAQVAKTLCRRRNALKVVTVAIAAVASSQSPLRRS